MRNGITKIVPAKEQTGKHRIRIRILAGWHTSFWMRLLVNGAYRNCPVGIAAKSKLYISILVA